MSETIIINTEETPPEPIPEPEPMPEPQPALALAEETGLRLGEIRASLDSLSSSMNSLASLCQEIRAGQVALVVEEIQEQEQLADLVEEETQEQEVLEDLESEEPLPPEPEPVEIVEKVSPLRRFFLGS